MKSLPNKGLPAAVAAALLALSGCVHTEPTSKLVTRASTIALPREVGYNMKDSAADFGSLVRGYLPHEKPMVIMVDIVPNETGIAKELPKDLGIYLVNAIQHIGMPFVVVRPTSSNVVLLDNPASAALNMPQAKTPAFDVKLKGVIMRDSDRIIRTGEGRVSLSAKIHGGDLSGDGGASNTATVRNLRVACYLEDAEGKSIPGQIAIYEVWFGNNESAANISLYFEGTGGGYNSKVQVNQDFGDAALDASTAVAISLIGKWLRLPYWRTNRLFNEDRDVEKDLRMRNSRLAGASLDSSLRLYLYGTGQDLDVTQPEVSAKDREIIYREARKAHWRPEVREDREKFLADLWMNLDYRAAAERMDRLTARLTRTLNEKQAAQAQNGAQLALPSSDPAPAAGPADSRVVLIDFSRLPAGKRKPLLEALAKVPTGESLQVREDVGACQLTYGGDPAVLQSTLRSTPSLSGLDYYWKDLTWKVMEVVPL